MAFTFKGGVHPHPMKELSKDASLKDAPQPDVVYIPLSQHIGAPAKAVVKKGDSVKKGQLIGEASAFVSCNIHSSVSGTVTKVAKMLDPVGRYVDTVVIENDKQDETDYMPGHDDVLSLAGKEIVEIAKNAGIAGMGGATFPTSVKLSPPKNKPIDVVILNGAECEPYLTADHRLMLEKPEEVVLGALLLKKAVDAKEVWIGIELNKPDAIEIMQKFGSKHGVEIAPLKTKYPQGAEKQLIDAVKKREVPSGGLPFETGCLVQNIGTAFALYEAAKFGKPLIDRVVTITGTLVNNPANLVAKVGTPYKELIELAGGMKDEPGKVISGGPMMGMALKSLDVPVTKGTSGILVFPKEMAKKVDEVACISCAMCVDICPMRLLPTTIAQNSRIKKWDEAEKLGALDCIECGSCSWICPSGQRLLDRIRRAKSEIMAIKRKGS